MIGFLLVGTFLYLIYYLAIKPYNFWSKKHVKTGPIVPFFGDNYLIVLGKESFQEMFERVYNTVQNVRYLGTYQFLTPGLVLKSPELIKQVCVKDFDHFMNHRPIVPEGSDDLFSKSLFALQGHAWKNMRSTLSPTFTSSKMKLMFVIISQNANTFVEHFLKKNEKIISLDFKDAFTRYSMDVIASSAFGIETDSLGNRDNEFYLTGKDASDFNKLGVRISFFFFQLAPQLGKLLGLKIFSSKVKRFFFGIVEDTLEMREKQNIQRPDMLGLLMDAKKGQLKENTFSETRDAGFAAVDEYLESKNGKGNLTDVDIAVQAFSFFIGGFDNISTEMCFMAYEMATNPDIQEKLIQEIDDIKRNNEDLTYEVLMKMVYMDMVVTEILRKWPLAIAADRMVSKPYTIQPELPDETPVALNKGDLVWIPIFSIHHDPKYYENPHKFDPERFSPENRKNIEPYTYLPFGAGPRNCIASRFALLEMKTLMFHLLSSFEIVPTEKTHIPLKLKKAAITLTSEHGFHFGLKRRC